MNPLTALLFVLVGSQIITNLTAVSIAKRTATSAGSMAGSRSAKHMHRIVFQVSVNDPERWADVLANAENLQKAFGPDTTQIEVICFGKGLDMLLNTDAPLAGRIAKDHAAGMAFAACRNTLRARNLAPADLLPAATPVDSGVAEIVRKEEAGWAYIKG